MHETQTALSYPAQLKKGRDGRYLVTFRDLPEALTDGGDREEARAEASDCLDEAIAARIFGNEAIPAPSSARRPSWSASSSRRARHPRVRSGSPSSTCR